MSRTNANAVCKNCIYFQQDEVMLDNGECHANPPRDPGPARWPEVTHNDWCSVFEELIPSQDKRGI
jgi:hypothetical protein